MTTTAPAVRDLSRSEIDEILARNTVGRLAYALRNRVDVEAMPYAYEAPWIYARTTPAMKVATVEHLRFVTLEVDEIAGGGEWRSVVVRGAFYVLRPDSARERPILEHALELLGREAGNSVVFRIPAHHAVGRAWDLRMLAPVEIATV
jgi:nitroimidazol reductase NimA-like FMN-containing flavoprotein (pyridoxamine 5'-phosphate oxidase superfamily)